MNWNFFWSMYIFAFAIAVWIIFYVLGVKKIKKGERCTAHTIGVVDRASVLKYAGFSIPCIQYMVNGKKYKVAGPKFRSASVISVSTPFEPMEARVETNLTTREELPLYLKVKIHKNSIGSVIESPIFKLFPMGSEVDVYYNPQKPKEAFVQRYEGVSVWITILLGATAIILTVSGFIILLGPELVMK